MDHRAVGVESFWFGDIAADDEVETWSGRLRRWFGGTAVIDRDIRERFGALADEATAGALDTWIGHPEELLGLVLIFDQFSRHLYRGTARAFTNDARARDLARLAITRGDLSRLPWFQRLFLILPLGHSEELDDQREGLTLMEALVVDVIPSRLQEVAEQCRHHARVHHDTIARFGRFPQRNQALDRLSTADELAFLDEQQTRLRPTG